jgi:hypothetical protein
MNVVIRFAIGAIALGMFFVPAQPAAAQCYGSACGAVLVPAPNPIPLRKLKVVPAPAPLPAPCGPGCVNAMNAWAGPPPCGQGGCGGPRAMVYVPKQTYAFWTPPAILGSAIVTGGGTAGTILSAAASAIKRSGR